MLTTEYAASVAFRFELKGKGVDEVVWRLCAANMADSAPFMKADLDDVGEFDSMLSDADRLFVFISGEQFVFCALYSPREFSPLARVYVHRQRYMEQDVAASLRSFRQEGFDFKPIQESEFKTLIGETGRCERVRTFREKLERETAPFATIHEGRKIAKVADGGIFLASDLCTVCKEPYEGLNTTTFSGGGDGRRAALPAMPGGSQAVPLPLTLYRGEVRGRLAV